jgi:hypothetical protein
LYAVSNGSLELGRVLHIDHHDWDIDKGTRAIVGHEDFGYILIGLVVSDDDCMSTNTLRIRGLDDKRALPSVDEQNVESGHGTTVFWFVVGWPVAI